MLLVERSGDGARSGKRYVKIPSTFCPHLSGTLLNMTVLTQIFSHDTTSGDEVADPEASLGAKTELVLIMAYLHPCMGNPWHG